ncbi:MAG: RNA 3'-terminal phosphate cyclase [Pseudomonadota bacterium]
MMTIDGRQGEGGGQILRTSLSLAMCLGKTVRIENIRAGRGKPGLMRQHLACVRAATDVCDATVEGDQIGSGAVTFTPGKIRAGDYRVAIGSAGSTTLVLQTVLPALLQANGESTVSLEGGTHNGMAPSFDFLALSFAPVLARMGVQLELSLERHGFFPNGGGRATVRITPPEQWKPLDLVDAPASPDMSAVVTYANLARNIARRERDYLKRKARLKADALRIDEVRSPGPGNVVSVHLQNDGFVNVFDAYAARGLKAERVAGRALRSAHALLGAGVPVDEHLADQLLLPMAIGAGGSFVTGPLSLHTQTNIHVIRALSGIAIQQRCVAAGQNVIDVLKT